jgi:hypothetical protein
MIFLSRLSGVNTEAGICVAPRLVGEMMVEEGFLLLPLI